MTTTKTRKPQLRVPPADIIKARKAAGLTQRQAAMMVCRSTRNWQQWESGERHIDFSLWCYFRSLVESDEKHDLLKRCHEFLVDLNGSDWINKTDAESIKRSRALQDAVNAICRVETHAEMAAAETFEIDDDDED